jgi:hypothetical protein
VREGRRTEAEKGLEAKGLAALRIANPDMRFNLVEMRGFEPLTSCMRSKYPELHDFLNYGQLIEYARLLIWLFW